jgi:hypothetical protein
MEHDFFEDQPIIGADIYLSRWCLHDWPDRYCLRILRSLVPAMRSNSRVLIMDALLGPAGAFPAAIEKEIRFVSPI